jgi:hypothetical protein
LPARQNHTIVESSFAQLRQFLPDNPIPEVQEKAQEKRAKWQSLPLLPAEP